MAKCIYCGSSGPFDREHSPPRCLGTFKGVEPLKARVCKVCNGRLGELDNHFCRSGPQAFFRRLLDIKGRKGHAGYSPFESGPDGGPAIEVLGPCPGQAFFILLDPAPKPAKGPPNMEPLRQIVVRDSSGVWHPIFVPESVRSPEKLRGLVSRKVERVPKEIRCFFDRGSEGWLPDLVQKSYHGNYSEETIPPATGPTRATVQLLVRDKYFRAIAKIVFHYYLQSDETVRGDEPEFERIRQFIVSGGDIDDFVIQTGNRPIWGAARPVRFKKHGHLITAERHEDRVFGWAEFMIGPDIAGSHAYYVQMGKPPGSVIWSKGWGTHFHYYDCGRSKEGFDGATEVMHPLSGRVLPVTFTPVVYGLTAVVQGRHLMSAD